MKQREMQRQAQRSSKCLGRNLLVAWAVGVLLGGCSATSVSPISQLNASPANFDGKEVMLRGVAKDVTRMPLLNLKSYVLKDDSGEATILTERELPKMNEEIRVKVKVRNFAIINGESLGTTFVEVERH
ncbi:hypothetical protein SAMN05216299_11027 [Nitrosospira sp. Nsp14]|uniref:hypothetical protein n=1 Tax=Nitrosospira sp. Nsp14 TaxID=1855333 RepID=UPI0008E1F406|nr:hypothetical protein [Nitrosospira sp. Nsp14]SFH39243.1 hypothetical protein SAMN05216299_11027 [Nitrosospira sp. Nsp14]